MLKVLLLTFTLMVASASYVNDSNRLHPNNDARGVSII